MDLDQLEKGIKDFLIANCIDVPSLNGKLIITIDTEREKVEGEVKNKLKPVKISKSSQVISA